MNILFTVCGRAGSKGFKNKNLKVMNGIPLVYYTLAAIRGYMDHNTQDKVMVAVNTDSQILIDLIRKQNGIKTDIIERKTELAGDFVPKVDVIQDTYRNYNSEMTIDAVIDLDITSPLRKITDIENAIRIYKSEIEYDLVFSVVKARRSPYFNMVEKKDEYYRKVCVSNYTARQETSKVYELNASIYVYSPSFLKNEITNTILDNKCGISIMEDYLVLDIDSEEDFRMMEFLHKYYCEHDEGLREIYTIAGGWGNNEI